MPDPQDFLCLITFDEPSLFNPWFEWLRLSTKCSRFTAALTQWFAFISLLGSDWNSTVFSVLMIGTTCIAPRTEQVTELIFVRKARWRKKWLMSHKARSLNNSFADTQQLQFNSEAYVECHHTLTDPNTVGKKALKQLKAGRMSKNSVFPRTWRITVMFFPIYFGFSALWKRGSRFIMSEWRSESTVCWLGPVLKGMI